MDFVMTPIGEIHSPFTDPAHTPIQPMRSTATGQVEVYAPYVDGLKDLEWLLARLAVIRVASRQRL